MKKSALGPKERRAVLRRVGLNRLTVLHATQVTERLNGRHTVFGEVVEGMNVMKAVVSRQHGFGCKCNVVSTSSGVGSILCFQNDIDTPSPYPVTYKCKNDASSQVTRWMLIFMMNSNRLG